MRIDKLVCVGKFISRLDLCFFAMITHIACSLTCSKLVRQPGIHLNLPQNLYFAETIAGLTLFVKTNSLLLWEVTQPVIKLSAPNKNFLRFLQINHRRAWMWGCLAVLCYAFGHNFQKIPAWWRQIEALLSLCIWSMMFWSGKQVVPRSSKPFSVEIFLVYPL